MNTNGSSSFKCEIFGTSLLFLALVGCAAPALSQFDPSASFSAAINPNVVWSYGFDRFPLGGSPFSLLPLAVPVPSAPGPSVDSWQAPAVGEIAVLHNGTGAIQTVTTLIDNAVYDPGMLAMHPGPNDEYGVVQFTAPANGFYVIHGVFRGIDTFGTTSDVHLLLNNSVVASDTVTGFGPLSDKLLSAGPFPLILGDTLAYAVGFGLGGPAHDTTALISASVDAVAPEPSSFALLGFAAAGLAAWGWRRRKQASRR